MTWGRRSGVEVIPLIMLRGMIPPPTSPRCPPTMLTGGITTELWPPVVVEGWAWLRLAPTMLTLLRVLLICNVPAEVVVVADCETVELELELVLLGLKALSGLVPAWIREVCWREQAWMEEACWRKIGLTLGLGPDWATARNCRELELST